jgi:GMP synthase (glutamine-hydrolysing)
VPEVITVWENHNDEIKVLPDKFMLLGSSATCKVQAFEHQQRPIFSFQFHPEVQNTQFGNTMFQNFIKICGT